MADLEGLEINEDDLMTELADSTNLVEEEEENDLFEMKDSLASRRVSCLKDCGKYGRCKV